MIFLQRRMHWASCAGGGGPPCGRFVARVNARLSGGLLLAGLRPVSAPPLCIVAPSPEHSSSTGSHDGGGRAKLLNQAILCGEIPAADCESPDRQRFEGTTSRQIVRPQPVTVACVPRCCVSAACNPWQVTKRICSACPCCRYNPELTGQWTREIADEIKSKLKNDLELPRYKFVVQVVVGEQRGEGVRMGCRCLWDADTDSYAEESYRNDSLFCVAAVFGAYLY